MTTLPQREILKLSDDIGVNTFINRLYPTVTLPSGSTSFDRFLKTYKFTQESTKLESDLLSVVVKINNFGSIRSNHSTPFNWSNPLISNSGITNFNDDSNLTTLTRLTSTTQSQYWLSPNKYWILYYNRNSNPKFSLYYNPIYRPGFLDFSAYNITENVVPFFKEYCNILNNGGSFVNNLDDNCRFADPTLPPSVVNFTRRIFSVAPSTVPPTITSNIVDSIKIFKSGTSSMNIKNIIIRDFNGNDIISSLPTPSKSCNFTNVNNPYIYIYFGDFNVKEVVIEGDPVYNNLSGAVVQLLNNTSIVYSMNLLTTNTSNISTLPNPTPSNYVKPSFIWNVAAGTGPNALINDAIVAKVVVYSAENTPLNISKINVINKDNLNLALSPVASAIGGKLIGTGMTSIAGDIGTNYPRNLLSSNNNEFALTGTGTDNFLGIELNTNSTILSILSKIYILNAPSNKQRIQNSQIRFLDRDNNLIASSLYLPGDFDNYTLDIATNSLTLIPASNVLIAKSIRIKKDTGNFNVNLDIYGSSAPFNINTSGTTVSSGSSTGFVVPIRNNLPLSGDYIDNVKISPSNNVAGCYLELLDANNNVIQTSDLLMNMSGSSYLTWYVKDNNVKYFNTSGVEVKAATPQMRLNNTLNNIANISGKWSLPPTKNFNCPDGYFINEIQTSLYEYGGDVNSNGMVGLRFTCKNPAGQSLSFPWLGSRKLDSPPASSNDKGFKKNVVGNSYVITSMNLTRSDDTNTGDIVYGSGGDRNNAVYITYDCGNGKIAGIRTDSTVSSIGGNINNIGFNCASPQF